MAISLRIAEPSDVATLKYWDTKPHVIASGGIDDSYDWEKEVARVVPWQEILIAEIDNRPIGVIVAIDPAEEITHYWGEIEANLRALDIWIGEEADLDKGYGTQMMEQVLKRCFSDPKIKAVLVDPLITNIKALNFYEKMGFKQIEQRKFGNDECFVYKIERRDYEK